VVFTNDSEVKRQMRCEQMSGVTRSARLDSSLEAQPTPSRRQDGKSKERFQSKVYRRYVVIKPT
jgi:hypothetical protein